jgi:hypothetical protein
VAQKGRLNFLSASTCPTRFDNSNNGAPMITGRKIDNGSNGTGGGVATVRKTPLMAALQATANHSVSGIITASQVARRWPGVRSVLSRPSHKPSAINPWAINWWAVVGTPLAGISGCQ